MKCRYLIQFLLTVVLCVACTDDDSFTTSPSYLLTFSTDTVKMDTVFSKIPSSTRTFWVFNRSGEGIRCVDVRLANGNQTGYRVNVDGVYLGQSAGYQTHNLEIRNKDSIRVFVELTSPENGYPDPQILEDNLVFTLESGAVQKVNLNAYTWDADILTDVTVKDELVLEGSKPTIIYGMMRVEEGATLRIPAGKTVYFHGNSGLEVYGRLMTEGTAEANVVLRGDRMDRMFDYLPYDMVSGQWQGIHIYESSYDNVMEYTDVHSTFNGIVCDSAAVDRQKLTMRNVTVHNCQGAGLSAVNAKVTLENCQLTNTLGACLDILGGDCTLNHCTLAQFYPFDSNRGPALLFAADAQHPLEQLNCMNSIITGYAEDVIMGAQNDSTTFNYTFAHSILRTPEVDDSTHFTKILWEEVKDTAAISGEKLFMLVDIDKQRYDFHLSEKSTAIGKADKNTSLPADRDGRARDEEPDAGCYEEIKSEK